MLNFLRLRATPLTLLICLAFIAMRMSGAHAHRHVELAHGLQTLQVSSGIFHKEDSDGHQRSTQADAGFHLEHAAEPVQHEDIGVAVIANSFGKLFKFDLTLLVLLAFAAFWLLAPRRAGPVPDYSPPRRPSLRAYLRPPLRGPPVLSVV